MSVLVLFLILGGNFQYFTIKYDVNYGFFINGLYYDVVVYSYLEFV